MGRSKKTADKKETTAGVTDDELLDQAIADNTRQRDEEHKEQELHQAEAEKQKQQQQQQQQQRASVPAPPKGAVSKETIVEKLNAVPTFCLLNGESNIVSIEDGEGGEAATWFTDAEEASEVLAAAQADNPGLPLHLGVTPLGLAFAFAVEWIESIFVGSMRLQGKR